VPSRFTQITGLVGFGVLPAVLLALVAGVASGLGEEAFDSSRTPPLVVGAFVLVGVCYAAPFVGVVVRNRRQLLSWAAVAVAVVGAAVAVAGETQRAEDVVSLAVVVLACGMLLAGGLLPDVAVSLAVGHAGTLALRDSPAEWFAALVAFFGFVGLCRALWQEPLTDLPLPAETVPASPARV
jgi:hypothetical protein